MSTETGIDLIARERGEMITKHGFTVKHDVEHRSPGMLANAAKAILLQLEHKWPFEAEMYRSIKAKPRREQLAYAGAFIAAEIDRIDAVDAINADIHAKALADENANAEAKKQREAKNKKK